MMDDQTQDGAQPGMSEPAASAEAASTEADTPEEGSPLIKPSSTEHELFEPVIDALKSVYDPEIPVNIYDLGLIYRVGIDADGAVEVDMTLTAPGCPVAGEIPGWVADAVLPTPGVKTVDVEIVWDPPWDMSRLSDEARLELGML